MGYELKLYVVETNDTQRKDTVLPDGDNGGYSVYSEEDSTGSTAYYHYCRDGNKKIYCTKMKDTFVYVKYASLLAMVDICKPGVGSEVLALDSRSQPTGHYIYRDGGNTILAQDHYGKLLREASLHDTIEALKSDCASDDYRRYKAALAVLEAFKEDFRDVKVLFFGH